jgi:gas vesicle protein
MSATKYWAAFTLGIAAGTAVALLYAPQTGVKTRKQLKKNWDDAGDYVRDYADDVSEQAGKAYKRGRSAVDEIAKHATKVSRKVADLG